MGWEAIIALVIKYGPEGIDLAEHLWQKWSTKTPPTQADFEELRALASQTAADRLKAQLVAAKIPLDSPQAIALIAQAS